MDSFSSATGQRSVFSEDTQGPFALTPACSPAFAACFQDTPALQSHESPASSAGTQPSVLQSTKCTGTLDGGSLCPESCEPASGLETLSSSQDSARQALLPGSLPGNPQKNLVGSSLNEHLSHLAPSSPGMASPSSPFLPFLQLSLAHSTSHWDLLTMQTFRSQEQAQPLLD